MFGTALLWLASLLAPALQAPPPSPQPLAVDKIADDFYVIRGGDASNTSIYITDEGIVLVDPKFARTHADLIAKVSELSKQPIKYVLNTHAHEDHTGGNAAMAPAVIVGHANQRDIMLKRNLQGVPQLTFDPELRMNLGGKEVVARYFGRCHTGGDSFIYFPARRVMATGDCITRGNPRGVANPPTSSRILIDYDNGGSFREAVKTVELMLKWDFDTVVPGHGPLGTKADVVKWHEGLQRLESRVSAMLREGKGRDAVVEVLVKEFEWDPNSVGDRATGLINELKP